MLDGYRVDENKSQNSLNEFVITKFKLIRKNTLNVWSNPTNTLKLKIQTKVKSL